MASYDKNQYKHLPRFSYFIYNCHFPNKSVNHSENPYAVPEDYKNNDNFLQHYRSLRLSHNTDIDYISAFPHFYYVVDLYEAIMYNLPHPDPTPFIQHGDEPGIMVGPNTLPFLHFSISALTLTYHDAWNRHDAPHKLCEPTRSQARSMLNFR